MITTRADGRGTLLGTIEDVTARSATCILHVAALECSGDDDGNTVKILQSVGSRVKIQIGTVWLVAEIRTIKRLGEHQAGLIAAEIEYVGEGDIGDNNALTNFRRGVSCYPLPGCEVHAVTHDDVVEMFCTRKRSRIEIGGLYPTLDLRASINVNPLLGKNFAIVGSSGCGKSTLVALMLQRILQKFPDGHIVVIDPHGEYVKPFSSIGVAFNVDNLRVPYWVMNFEEHCELFLMSKGAERETDKDILAKCLLTARSSNASLHEVKNVNVNTPVPYAIKDLLDALEEQMGRLEKAAHASHYIRLKLRIEELARDSRYAFMLTPSLFHESLNQVISSILRLPSAGRPVSIIDLSGIPSEVANVVVAALGRLIFSFASWSRQMPISLVCEEAQNYLPSGDANVSVAARRIFERIAKEGRKYGVSLGLVTQRPSDLSEAILSQCGTVFAMRLVNERDQAYIRNAMPESGRHLTDALQALRNRECIVSGEGVAIPIRVLVDELEPGLRPSSDDPVFSQAWTKCGGEQEIVETAILRWLNVRQSEPEQATVV